MRRPHAETNPGVWRAGVGRFRKPPVGSSSLPSTKNRRSSATDRLRTCVTEPESWPPTGGSRS